MSNHLATCWQLEPSVTNSTQCKQCKKCDSEEPLIYFLKVDYSAVEPEVSMLWILSILLFLLDKMKAASATTFRIML